MSRYALFLGCTIPARLNSYDLSSRRVAEALGIELVDLEGAGCCGTPDMESLDHTMAAAMAAWNLSLAEEQGLDIVVLCNGCHEVLRKYNVMLKQDSKLLKEVNEILSKVGREYEGTVEVKHYVKVLYDDIGPDKIRQMLKKPFKGLRAAVHYGCHMLRPSELIQFDDPENPHILDDLVNATGAVSVDYPDKLECCGAPILAVNEELSNSIAKYKVQIARKYADVMITACPFCFMQYEGCQVTGWEGEQLPVLHYPQLLGLALGMEFEELGINENRIDASKILEFL
ncbi:disulfide reductase [Candidatus Bathyarchaeota archaeon]|nr:MAG: disulfide reductase [Candidatus Bathyarchaeota archaeon]